MSAKSYLVEFIGTFMITFLMAMVRINNQEDLLCVGLAAFFLMVAMIHTCFHFSSAQFNPILSLSLLITKQNSFNRAVIYVLMHLLASFLAGSMVYLLNRDKESGKYFGSPQMNAAMRESGMVFEMVAMFLLVFVYNYFMSNVTAPKYVYGTAISGVYTISIIGFGFISGGATNFSFIFGPSIYMGNFVDWAYYFFGHLIGGIVSGIMYRLFLMKDDDHEEEEQAELNETDDNFVGATELKSQKMKAD